MIGTTMTLTSTYRIRVFRCRRCRHKWPSRVPEGNLAWRPRKCPNCSDPYWQWPPIYKFTKGKERFRRHRT